MAHRILTASAAVLLTTVPAGWAASSSLAASNTPTPSGTSNSASQSPTPTSSGAEAPTTSGGVHVDQPLRLHLDDKGAIDQGALPQPEALFTTKELQSLLPDLRSTTGQDGAIALVLPGESGDDRSHLLVTMKRFGRTADITKTWADEKRRHEARSARNPGLYTFYRSGQNGVTESFTDGTTAHALITDGDAAGEIWISGVGFGDLKATHAESRAAYTTSITPKLLELLGAKVRAGHAESPSATTAPSA